MIQRGGIYHNPRGNRHRLVTNVAEDRVFFLHIMDGRASGGGNVGIKSFIDWKFKRHS